MKFNICKILLWLKAGSIREIELKANKVNVITGDSHTGKTAILHIIDYCLFASKAKIAESIINENVLWYGIQFEINQKKFTLARGQLQHGTVSPEYYFSSTGEIPERLNSNNEEETLKRIIEAEFGINNNVSIPYGGRQIKLGSKVSLRYFLMFITISDNIIEADSGVFFDRQNEDRYREALPRIFDLALGIETVDNILRKERKIQIEAEIEGIRRRTQRLQNKKMDFEEEIKQLILKAKTFGVIDGGLTFDESLAALKAYNPNVTPSSHKKNIRELLEKKGFDLKLKIRNIEAFLDEDKNLKSSISQIEDSLRPIEYIKEHDSDLIKTSIYSELVDSLMRDLRRIQESIAPKKPIEAQAKELLTAYRKNLRSLEDELAIIPACPQQYKNETEKAFFLGEVKAKLSLYLEESAGADQKDQQRLDVLKKELSELEIVDTDAQRNNVCNLVEEVIRNYMKMAENSLGNYAEYQPLFDYKTKALKFRKPGASYIESVGSSSNHMFMHLFFSLAMHDVAIKNKSPFIPPFLIIDQPSRPYYGEPGSPKETIDSTDEYKIRKAFELLNFFVKNQVEDGNEFQMLVLEHVPSRLLENLDFVHILPAFREGNALIPDSYLKEKLNDNKNAGDLCES